MARRQQAANVLETAAVGIGRALGTIARRVDAWKKDRAEITADINQVIARAQEMLDDVARTPTPDAIGSLGEIAHVAPSPTGRRTTRGKKSQAATPGRTTKRSGRTRAATKTKSPR